MRGTSCNCLVVVRCAATPSFNSAFRGRVAKTAAFECVHACSTHVQKQSCEQCMNSVNIGIAARKGVLVCIHFEGWVWFSDVQCAFGRAPVTTDGFRRFRMVSCSKDIQAISEAISKT